jgi:hypothetical protein
MRLAQLSASSPQLDFLQALQAANGLVDRMGTLRIFFNEKGARLLLGGMRGAVDVITDGGPVDDDAPSTEVGPSGRAVISDRAFSLRVSEFSLLVASGALHAAYHADNTLELELGNGPADTEGWPGVLLVQLEVE